MPGPRRGGVTTAADGAVVSRQLLDQGVGLLAVVPAAAPPSAPPAAAGQHAEDEWPDRIPLGPPPPPPLPTTAAGPILGPLCDAIAAALQVPPDLPLTLGLALVSTAVRGRWKVRLRAQWVETLALATLAALNSGERKSPALAMLSRVLYRREQAARDEVAAKAADGAVDRQVLEDEAEAARKAAGKPGATEEAREAYREACRRLREHAMPVAPRWLVDDVTPEALGQLLAQHGALGAVSAEPGLFGILAGRYSSGAPNIETVLKAISGDPIRIDRVGRDPVFIDDPALSMGVCIQPGRLPELGTSVFRYSGLLARFLYALPAPVVGTRDLNATDVPAELLDVWESRVSVLLATTPPEDAELSLSPEARAEFDRFRGALEPRLHPVTGDLAAIADWGSKLPGAVARIAGVLTLLDSPGRRVIDADTMTGAVQLGEAFILHAVHAFRAIHAKGAARDRAAELLEWIRRSCAQNPQNGHRANLDGQSGSVSGGSVGFVREPVTLRSAHYAVRSRANQPPARPPRPPPPWRVGFVVLLGFWAANL